MTIWVPLSVLSVSVALSLRAGRSRTDRRLTQLAAARRGVTRRSGRPYVRVMRRRSPAGAIPDDLLAEVVAALVESGAPPVDALRRIADDLGAKADPREGEWRLAEASSAGLRPTAPDGASRPGGRSRRQGDKEPPGVVHAVAAAIALAGRTGLSPGELIRSCARDARRIEAERAARRLGRLPVLLVLPMGLCLLPAALLLGVVPVVLGLLAQVLP